MSETYAEIMARTPPIKWAMPSGGVTLAEITARNEYTLDRLKAAAEIVWLASIKTASFDVPGVTLPDAPSSWIADEIVQLRRLLDTSGPQRVASRRDFYRWRALCIVNLPRVLASSSRVVEVPDA